MGAKASGGGSRHGGVDAELARLIAGGGNHPPAGGAAHDDGLALERRVVALLDGRVEGVHVDMQDGVGPVHGGDFQPWMEGHEPY